MLESSERDEVNTSLIRAENLVKIFQIAEIEVVALQGLDLEVTAGEMLGIVGASGSGKSTLLNVLGGLARPSAGQVHSCNIDLLKASGHQLDDYRRKKVGFVWQQTGRNLLPYLTAQQNIELPMTLDGISRRARRAWTQELLQAVGLWERRTSKLTHLSGGQQQRVAIGVALANKPPLLLADEPTGGVDTQNAEAVLSLLHHVNEQYGTTVIVVTHDQQTAAAMARVVTMRDGRVSTEALERSAESFTIVDRGGRLTLPEAIAAKLGTKVRFQQTETGIEIRGME